MQFKQKLAYMALGSLFTLAGYLLASVVGDVKAQDEKQSVEFDTVVCRGLKIVNEKGRVLAFLGKIADEWNIFRVYDEENKKRIIMGTSSDSSYLRLLDPAYKQVNISTGHIMVSDAENGGMVDIRVDKSHSRIDIVGEGKNRMRATMAIDESGNGFISTWNKNGYRTGNLP